MNTKIFKRILLTFRIRNFHIKILWNVFADVPLEKCFFIHKVQPTIWGMPRCVFIEIVSFTSTAQLNIPLSLPCSKNRVNGTLFLCHMHYLCPTYLEQTIIPVGLFASQSPLLQSQEHSSPLLQANNICISLIFTSSDQTAAFRP